MREKKDRKTPNTDTFKGTETDVPNFALSIISSKFKDDFNTLVEIAQKHNRNVKNL